VRLEREAEDKERIKKCIYVFKHGRQLLGRVEPDLQEIIDCQIFVLEDLSVKDNQPASNLDVLLEDFLE